jgi:hypothetical protein
MNRLPLSARARMNFAHLQSPARKFGTTLPIGDDTFSFFGAGD